MLAFFAFILAMFISMLLIPPLMRSAERFAFVDMPSERKVHERPIPRIGGLAMVAGALAPVVLWLEPVAYFDGYLWGVGAILAFGLWDDRRNLHYGLKFAGQLIAVLFVVFHGGLLIRYVPLMGIEPIPYWPAVALTIFALLGVTNAINLADGLDGLAGGITLLSLGMLALLAYLSADLQLVLVAMAVMGGIVGFLRFNTHPAQVFMGDAGSQFLGFSAGVLVIVLTQKTNPVLSPSMALLLLGLPLLDTLIVMTQRLMNRRSPFKPDRRHIHHRLMDLGLDHYEVVVVIYALQASLVSLGFVMRYHSDWLNLALFAGFLVAIAGLTTLSNRRGWRLRQAERERPQSAMRRLAGKLKQRALMTRVPTLFAGIAMPASGLYAAASLGRVPADGRVTTFALLAGSLAALAWKPWRQQFLLAERLLLYVMITTLVFYWGNEHGGVVGLRQPENIFFMALGGAVLVAYRFGHNRNFRVTPTDFLIILIALLVPTLTRTLYPQQYLGEVAIKTLVLFYALELLLAEWGRRLLVIRVAAAVVMITLGVRILDGSVTVAG